MKITVVIPASSYNIKLLENRGVFSDDSRFVFHLFDKILSGNDIYLSYDPYCDVSRNNYTGKMQDIINLGLNF